MAQIGYLKKTNKNHSMFYMLLRTVHGHKLIKCVLYECLIGSSQPCSSTQQLPADIAEQNWNRELQNDLYNHNISKLINHTK